MKVQLAKRQEWIRGRRQKRKVARLARLRRQILRYLLLTVLLSVGVAGFAYLPWDFVNSSTDCQIHGNRVVTDDQVRSTLKAFAGRALFRLDPRSMEASVSTLPAVRYAFVRRFLFPHPHLVVEIMEEFPWASFSSSPDSAVEGVIAEGGKYIPVSQFPAIVRPILKICGPHNMKLSASQIAQWDSCVALIAAQTGQTVDLVDLRQPSAIEVRCGDLSLHLGAADSTLTRRLGRLSSVVPVISSVKDRLEYIDLSLDSNIPLKVSKTPRLPDSERAARLTSATHPAASTILPPGQTSSIAPAL